MANKSNFIAATGTYYVMACLSRECIHAACTFGNAPSVDIMASSVDGSKTISIQVKTSSYARTNKGEKLAWFFKYDITKNTSPNHFYIFQIWWVSIARIRNTGSQQFISSHPSI
jgi:hypothetical protein